MRVLNTLKIVQLRSIPSLLFEYSQIAKTIERARWKDRILQVGHVAACDILHSLQPF